MKKKKLKITINPVDREITEERDDIWDKTYGKNELDRLTKGIVEVIEEMGIVQDDEILEVNVDCDDTELYEKAKKIEHLNNEIKKRKLILHKMNKEIGQMNCNEPTQQELFNYCRELVMVSKGKKENG